LAAYGYVGWIVPVLLYVAFGNTNIQLPRASFSMAEEGEKINLKNISKGATPFLWEPPEERTSINHCRLSGQ